MKPSIAYRFPLAVKMALTMLLVVCSSWFIVQKFEAGALRDFFFEYHLKDLQHDAQEELLRFIQHLRARKNTVRSLITQKKFHDYMQNIKYLRNPGDVLHYESLPPWFPPRNITRAHLSLSYAILVDPAGKVREVYNGIGQPLPQSLLYPDELLPRLRNTESILTNIDGNPYQLVIKHISNSSGRSGLILMFAFPLDSKFIKTSQGALLGNHIVALLDTNNEIMASSKPDDIIRGQTLASLEEKYLVTQKSFFDYGESEIDIKFTSLVPKSDINALAASILGLEFKYAIIYGITFVLSSTLIVLYLSGKLRNVTVDIVNFLSNNLDKKYYAPSEGDELYTLQTSFNHMKKEILDHQENMKKHSTELQNINEELQREIAERILAKNALEQSELKFRNLVETTNDWVWEVDENAVYTYASPKVLDILGYSPDEILEKTPLDFMSDEEAERVKKIFGVIAISQQPFELLENTNIHKDGHHVVLETSGVPVFDAAGVFRGYRGMDRNITGRKLAENKIKASLKEKEVLLKEIHHRAKNNMQVISSLLNMQSEKVKGHEYATMFHESRNRIQSMALVHEKLYQSKDLTNIDFKDYIRSLVNGLFMFYGVNPGTINIGIDVMEVNLPIDTAIPCGLIINELVSNSLKYAFPNNRKGKITISFKETDSQSNRNEYNLIISDNGIGLPDNAIGNQSKSLGLQLVKNLAEHQMQGEVEIEKSAGTSFSIHFKELKYKKRI